MEPTPPSGTGVVLVTGAAGFIGYHCARRLLEQGLRVVGLDNLNAYYDPRLKDGRLADLRRYPGFSFERVDLAHREEVFRVVRAVQAPHILHLAAQAGVRYSLENPGAYVDSNLVGFMNLLEAAREARPAHVVFASSSSVYGLSGVAPFSTTDATDHPASLYAATKKANEALAHAYAHLFALPFTALRFFTVYGPWGRPDMAAFIFTRKLFRGEVIELYNHGEMERDFTYVDDVVESIARLLALPPTGDPAWRATRAVTSTSRAPWRVLNIGNHSPVRLRRFLEILEGLTGRTALIRHAPMSPADVVATCANVDDLAALTGFAPRTSIEAGLAKFVAWYREAYPEDVG